LVSRGGYDSLFDPSEEQTIFVIEPTHEAEPFHHFGPGCTKIFGLDECDIIELRNEDQSCKLEIDGWEMIWYLPDCLPLDEEPFEDCSNDNLHFDVWLTRDGIANICLSVFAGYVVENPFLSLYVSCGLDGLGLFDEAPTYCWEWDICPDTSYGWVDETADELATDNSFIDWYGGWGLSGEAIPSYELDEGVAAYYFEE